MPNQTPLRTYLQRVGMSAEAFAAQHSLSPWNIRHWSRGDKMPSLASQAEIAEATDGEVTPESWLAWRLDPRSNEQAA